MLDKRRRRGYWQRRRAEIVAAGAVVVASSPGRLGVAPPIAHVPSVVVAVVASVAIASAEGWVAVVVRILRRKGWAAG